jgi:hypothetical protein
VQREREGKEEGHAGQMSRKPEREAQKTKDGAMSGTGVGWSMGLGYRQQSQICFCASPSMPVRSSLATCRHPRNPSVYPAASLCIFHIHQCRATSSLSSLVPVSKAVDHVSKTLSTLPDSAPICSNYTRVCYRALLKHFCLSLIHIYHLLPELLSY